jgi:hypothetical protein
MKYSKACRALARLRTRLEMEVLEARALPSAAPGALVLAEQEANDVLTSAQDLTVVSPDQALDVAGTLGDGASRDADVDWYQFSLQSAGQVTLNLDRAGVLSLYQEDALAPPLGYQRVAQSDPTASLSATVLTQTLLPGTYFVAVSGAGNRYFSPFVPDSGTPGTTGGYHLRIDAADAGIDPANGLQLVRSDVPPAGYQSAPLTINLVLSQPIDLGVNLVLLLDADGNDLGPITAFDPATGHLSLTPTRPLDVGDYTVAVFDDNFNLAVALPFSVVGREGHAGTADADDTIGTASDLGDLTRAGTVQVAGAIGDDPFYEFAQYGLDADFYHFTITGGPKVLSAEAFAGRIGSPLDPSLTLLRVVRGPAGEVAGWELVAGNYDSHNPLPDATGKTSLGTDPLLITRLTAGEYVLVVGATDNAADPLLGQLPGQDGRFDPLVSHSGARGSRTGAYVLNLAVQNVVGPPPRVVDSSISPGQTVTGAPASVTVRFSAAIDVPRLFAQSALDPSAPHAVYVEAANGQRYFLRVSASDLSKLEVTFQFLDELPSGSYTLHLSGPGGLVDVAGRLLVSNDSGGDYVIPFEIVGSTGRAPLSDLANADDSFAAPTDLGTLFTHDLQSGITIRRDFSQAAVAPEDGADFYRFTILRDGTYSFSLGGAGFNLPGKPVLLDEHGNELTPFSDRRNPNNHTLVTKLAAGTYTITVRGWNPATAGAAVYELRLLAVLVPENPTPLHATPLPASRLQLFTLPTPSTPPPGPPGPVVPPVPVVPPGPPSPPPPFSVDPGPGDHTPHGPQLTLPTAPPPTITFAGPKADDGAPLSVGASRGAFAGLSVGPLGVVNGAAPADVGVVARLNLPSTDVGLVNVSTKDGDADALVYKETARLEEALRALVREALIIGMNWLRIPTVLPSVLVVGPTDALGTDVPAEATAETAPPAANIETMLGGETDAVRGTAPHTAAFALLALAPVLAGHDRARKRLRLGGHQSLN